MHIELRFTYSEMHLPELSSVKSTDQSVHLGSNTQSGQSLSLDISCHIASGIDFPWLCRTCNCLFVVCFLLHNGSSQKSGVSVLFTVGFLTFKISFLAALKE